MATTPSPPPQDRARVKKPLLLFAVLAIVGVFLLAFSVVLGLAFLVIAEVFFAVAYRRFSKPAKPAT